ncbi:tyrosine-type recombinase/integrase [Cellvibrio sp.]|uniref:phage integrase n=1 Tax=Cellvibrio sp. TaxID=1965322 RepID=UPI0039647AA9
MIQKLEDGRYKLDFYPAGRNGPRVVRIRETRKELKQIQADFEAAVKVAPLNYAADKRKLSELVNLWFTLHGVTLRDSKTRLARTLAICTALGDPAVNQFTAAHFSRYREKRLTEVSVSTVNHETRYLRAVFSELIRLEQYHGKNPLAKIRTFAERERELSFLTSEQIEVLLKACDESSNNHCGAVARLCLATGARWGEANALTRKSLFPDRVVFSDTKNGKVRVVPITPDFSAYLSSLAYPFGQSLFSSCKGAFRKAVDRSGIQLPDGQLTHVLRHTFASHYLINGGDILALQRILGHSDLKVTMRYAHLAPDYMASVTKLSPMSGFGF